MARFCSVFRLNNIPYQWASQAQYVCSIHVSHLGSISLKGIPTVVHHPHWLIFPLAKHLYIDFSLKLSSFVSLDYATCTLLGPCLMQSTIFFHKILITLKINFEQKIIFIANSHHTKIQFNFYGMLLDFLLIFIQQLLLKDLWIRESTIYVAYNMFNSWKTDNASQWVMTYLFVI